MLKRFFHWIISYGEISGVRREWKLSDSSDSDYVARAYDSAYDSDLSDFHTGHKKYATAKIAKGLSEERTPCTKFELLVPPLNAGEALTFLGELQDAATVVSFS